jgi:hypothetical protein
MSDVISHRDLLTGDALLGNGAWSMPVIQSVPAQALGARGSAPPSAAVTALTQGIDALSTRIDDLARATRSARLRRKRDLAAQLSAERAAVVAERQLLLDERRELLGH